jgi:hypothetical protein
MATHKTAFRMTVRDISVLQKSRPGAFVAGDQVSYGDVALFRSLSALKFGWIEGKTKKAAQ